MTHRLSIVRLGAVFVFALAGGYAHAEVATSSEAARTAIAAASNAIYQGQAAPAVKALSAVADDQFDGDDARHRACVLSRLESPPAADTAADDAFVRALVDTYRRYWWRALTMPAQLAAHEAALQNDLVALVGLEPPVEGDMAALETALQAALRRRGHYGLFGRTSPLLELMLWRTQTTREEAVALPEGEHRVRVELLDDFVSLGWSAWALCERSATGGWTTEEALFAVVPAYKDGLESEAFLVVFLAHEGQHFADKQRWPGLPAWELEYRAKLTELAMASDVLAQKRLIGFVRSQSDNLDSPHTYANKRVIEALQTRLGIPPLQAEPAALEAAALAALRDDTRRRKAAARAD